LNVAERVWIAALGTMTWGYNIYDGGDVHSVPVSTRQKLRSARLGTHASLETKVKLSEASRGRQKTSITRLRMSKGTLRHRSLGRIHPGTQHPFSKLTEAEVRAIRAQYAAGAVQRDLAEQFGICQSVVSRIIGRIAWSHV
jgi:hypothetical protein